MSNLNIWKLGAEVNANEYYDSTKNGVYYSSKGEGDNEKIASNSSLYCQRGEVYAANQLAEVCNEMSKTVNEIVSDKNEYLVDINASWDELSEMQDDIAAEIKKLEDEIVVLLNKKSKGTITEEEEAELDSKSLEVRTLQNNYDSQTASKSREISDKVSNASKNEEVKSKINIANDYGDTAVEKGSVLSETQDKKKSFWRKLFGGWNKSKEREAGKKLVNAGENLLEQVNISNCIDKKIKSKVKKSV